jgi:RNA polymerase sigma factor (TIGR02999 family)
MSIRPSRSVTELLRALQHGNDEAAERLFIRLYHELRRLARVVRRGKAPVTLNTTALVHEAYLHLRPDDGLDVSSKRHFFRLAARAMRQVIAREARHRNAKKRGGGAVTVSFHDRMLGTELPLADIVTLEDALDSLEQMDARQARVVECRFYAGLTVKETADVLDVSTATVKRDWRAAKAWLVAHLRPLD